MRRPDGLLDGAARALSTRLASGMTRKSFLGRMGGAMLAATGGAAVAAAVRPEKSEAFHFCGHIWTTGSCLNPLGLPRIDKNGFPLRPSDGHRIDNLGRPVNSEGWAVDGSGNRLRSPDGEFLPRAPRTRLCEDWTNEHYKIGGVMQGAWYRCCERPGAEARGLLLPQQEADQRRCVPDGLLLRRQARVLRPVLRLGAQVLAVAAALAATALLAGVSGAWSP